MGDMFTSQQARTSSENNQVGQQIGDDSWGVANSGRMDSGAVNTGTFIQSPTKIGKGAEYAPTINITQTDLGAINAGTTLGLAGLQVAQSGQTLTANLANAALHFAEQQSANQSATTMATLQANVITSAHALDANRQVTQTLLEQNSEIFDMATDAVTGAVNKVVNSNTDVTTQAINFAQQVSINSMGLAKSAVDAAQHTALNATPVSPGAYAEATGAQNSMQMKVAILGVLGVIAAAWISTKFN